MFRSERSPEDKLLPYFGQEQSIVTLDSAGFYVRVCEALGVDPGRGSKAKIARILGFTKTTAGSWEKGDMPGAAALHHVAKVSELSGTSLHWILTGEGPKQISDAGSGIPRYSLDPRPESLDPKLRAAMRKEIIEILGSVLSSADRELVDSLVNDLRTELERKRKP